MVFSKLFLSISIFYIIECLYCQLIVNVKNGGGEIYQEKIDANTTDDSINLTFRKSDGTLVSQFIDFRNEIQIFKAVVMPEEDLGQSVLQNLCFVTRFMKNDFISSDAMSKLRQKNPGAIRNPEDSLEEELFLMDSQLDLDSSVTVSPHIKRLCFDADDSTYAREYDMTLLADIFNRNISQLRTTSHKSLLNSVDYCSTVGGSSRPCICKYTVCVGWYPCGLKYCRGKDSTGRMVSYRCGIKTCSRCHVFKFYVRTKDLCVWDENEFRLPAEEYGVFNLKIEPPRPPSSINVDAAKDTGDEDEHLKVKMLKPGIVQKPNDEQKPPKLAEDHVVANKLKEQEEIKNNLIENNAKKPKDTGHKPGAAGGRNDDEDAE